MEVSAQTVINYFYKCSFRKERLSVQVLDHGLDQEEEEEEFASLVKELLSDVSPSDYTNFDMEVAKSQSPINVESIG